MPQFNAYPSSRVEALDIPALLQESANLRGTRTKNRLLDTKMQEFGAEQGRLNRLRGIMPGVGAEAGLGPNAQEALGLDPSMMSELLKIPKGKRDRAKEAAETLGNMGMFILNSPGVQRPALDARLRQMAAEYDIPPESIPPLGSPEYEPFLKSNIAKANKTKAMLDQVPDAPGGYRYDEGGDLAFTPGGPADPAQAKRLAEAKRDPSGGDRTALQKDVPYIAKLLGISKKEALALKIESKSKGYADYLRGIAGRYVSYGERPERAYELAKQVADLVYGRVAREPPTASPDSKEGRNYLEEIFGFFGGGETGPVKSKKGAAIMGSRKNPHMPKTQADFNSIPSGGIYIDPDDKNLYRKP